MKEKHFNLAKKLCEKANHEFRLACVLVKGNRVVNVGWNNGRKSHPKSRSWNNLIHAEFAALIGSCFDDTNGSDAYVYRLRNDGTSGMARPCGECERILRIAGIKRVYYSTTNQPKLMRLR